MPSAYFHQWVARQAYTALGNSGECPALLDWGAQGPDPLFYYRRLHPRVSRYVNEVGDKMHNQMTGRLLCQMLRRSASGSREQKMFALGFISHYATDQILHPYVYAQSYDRNLGVYHSNAHMMLEAKMDTWIWQREGNKGAPALYSTMVSREELLEAADLLSRSHVRAFPGDDLSVEQIMQAFSDARKYSRMLHCKSRFKYGMLRAAETILLHPSSITCHVPPCRLRDEEFLNVDGREWYSPWEPSRPRKESVPRLLEDAVHKSAEWVKLACAFWDGEVELFTVAAALGDVSYCSGLDWRNTLPLESGFRPRTEGEKELHPTK